MVSVLWWQCCTIDEQSNQNRESIEQCPVALRKNKHLLNIIDITGNSFSKASSGLWYTYLSKLGFHLDRAQKFCFKEKLETVLTMNPLDKLK
jgi:hypothetical protein